ncbi:MAG: transcriptional regulator [Roseofilum sp. SBFL]|uniref:anti-sigma factor family protein n=1 Tax=unclassified Roseofilum TaxID=2620099 RepID=UPI001B0C322F|nr:MULTISPECIES: hypothetical protein [unclassified Roseofilum]MBP0015595.1 transcriptional regulator [Roseofilum sp. SID3]MBP0022692.1 transcriptional regulator [Roseofilum sp. SID2]MBP0039252.1 transcriptional regulator [Roseofilum sp. SID1]MBP0042666.1 transcriptional regulator [Roseofilum sp. SBFL]
MTPHFDCQPHSQKEGYLSHLTSWNDTNPNSHMGVPDMLKRDRFELLSAYLDGEVSASESKQVEEWLDNDPTVQCLYQRLLKLRQGFEMLPTPPQEQPVEDMVTQVMGRLDRRPKRTALLWGTGAIAAAAVAVLSTTFANSDQLFPQIAETPTSPALMRIALDQPLINIPKSDNNPLGMPNATGDLHQMLQNDR